MRQILLRDSASRVANSKFRITRVFGCSDIYASVFRSVRHSFLSILPKASRHPIRIAVCKPGSINFEMHIFQLRHDFQRLNRSVNNCRKFGMFPAESDRIRIEPLQASTMRKQATRSLSAACEVQEEAPCVFLHSCRSCPKIPQSD